MRVSLTPRERLEGTRVHLSEAAQINTANFYSHAAVGPRRVEVLPNYDHTSFISGFVDKIHQRMWFGTSQSPGHVVSFDPNTREIVNTLTADSGEDQFQCAACDPAGAFGYFGTFTSPGQVVKVNLANGTRADKITLGPGENNLYAAAVDPAGTFAYFADGDSPSTIIKVRLTPTFQRADALPLASGDSAVRDLKISPDGKFLYVACATSPGRIVKIQLSDFTRVGALDLDSGENSPQALAIYPDGAFMYAACATFPSIIVKIRLSDFTHADALPLNPGEENATGLTLSNVSKYLLVACDTTPPTVTRINLTNFTREDAGALRSDTEVNLKTILFDNAGQHAFLAANTNPGRIVTFEAAPKPLRLGIYSEYNNTYQRVWQSPPLPVNLTASWITVPISQGTPNSLYLPGGNYVLAWQFDADQSGPSFTPGLDGDGIQFPMLYGQFPETLSAATGTAWTPTSSRWSMYLDYTSKNIAHNWETLR